MTPPPPKRRTTTLEPRPTTRDAKMAEYNFVFGDAMPTISPKRKQRAAPFKTSALESARQDTGPGPAIYQWIDFFVLHKSVTPERITRRLK